MQLSNIMQIIWKKHFKKWDYALVLLEQNCNGKLINNSKQLKNYH